jgi:hypothetical protein
VDVKCDTGHVSIFFGESIGSIAHNGTGSRRKVFVVARDIFKISQDVVELILYVTSIIDGD